MIEGNSHFYLTIDGTEGIFDFALPGLLDVVAYRVGDTISFTYIEGTGINTVYEILGEDGKPLAESAGEAAKAEAEANKAAEGTAAEDVPASSSAATTA